MAGGLINIVSYGFNDLYITGSPQITFFKIVYRRHTNFSKESIVVPVGSMNFNDELTINMPKVSDLAGEVYLQLEIPKISLLKTETATDLTDEEVTLLTTALQLPLSDEEKEIVDDYNTVLNFLAVNTSAYRLAISTYKIHNDSSRDFVDKILGVLNFTDSLNVDFQGALDRASSYEKNNGNNKLDYILDYRNSDINDMLNNTIVLPDAYASYTKLQILGLIENAMNTSIKVKKYYFEKVKQKHDLEKDANSLYAKFAWVKRLGHAMIDRIDINIGGERIDRHYGDWINLWYELTTPIEQDELYDSMIGNVQELTTYDRNSKPSYILTIPLSFWFCKKMGLAFPLIALQYSPISFTIKLKKIDECAYIEELPKYDLNGDEIDIFALTLSDIWENMGFTINCSLLIEYIYLDSLERKRFAQSAHEYLIETVQQMTIDEVTNQNTTVQLDFNGPCKEILWVATKSSYVSDDSTKIKYPFNYGLDKNAKGNPFVKSKLMFNGYARFDLLSSGYFSLLQPNSHHSRSPSDGVNVYSFGLYPEEHQPSCACNFSRIGNPIFTVVLDDNMFKYYASDIDPLILPGSSDDIEYETTVKIRIYAVRYNILRVIGGMGGFGYSYLV